MWFRGFAVNVSSHTSWQPANHRGSCWYIRAHGVASMLCMRRCDDEGHLSGVQAAVGAALHRAAEPAQPRARVAGRVLRPRTVEACCQRQAAVAVRAACVMMHAPTRTFDFLRCTLSRPVAFLL